MQLNGILRDPQRSQMSTTRIRAGGRCASPSRGGAIQWMQLRRGPGGGDVIVRAVRERVRVERIIQGQSSKTSTWPVDLRENNSEVPIYTLAITSTNEVCVWGRLGYAALSCVWWAAQNKGSDICGKEICLLRHGEDALQPRRARTGRLEIAVNGVACLRRCPWGGNRSWPRIMMSFPGGVLL